MAELLLHASGFVSRCSPSGSWNNTRERKGREKIKKGVWWGGGKELDQVNFYTICGEMGWMTGDITRANRFRKEHLAECGILLPT